MPHKVFVDGPDVSDRNFDDMFRDQIQPSGSIVTRLAAEVVAVHFCFRPVLAAFESARFEDFSGTDGDFPLIFQANHEPVSAPLNWSQGIC